MISMELLIPRVKIPEIYTSRYEWREHLFHQLSVGWLCLVYFTERGKQKKLLVDGGNATRGAGAAKKETTERNGGKGGRACKEKNRERQGKRERQVERERWTTEFRKCIRNEKKTLKGRRWCQRQSPDALLLSHSTNSSSRTGPATKKNNYFRYSFN